MRKNGFTLVEIMIVVAIVAALAAIAIPNLLRAKRSANDARAKGTLRVISTAAESYASSNMGNYPLDITSLTGASPAYLNSSSCDQSSNGYSYVCTFGLATYTVIATPLGDAGSTTYTITTGGVLTPA